MSLKELSKELLAQLKRHPQSARQLAAAVNRNRNAVGKACMRLQKLGYIKRGSNKKWIFVTSEPVLEPYRVDWSVESARECYLGGLLSRTSLASSSDLTIVGAHRRRWDEAGRYLEHHDPESLEYGERARASVAGLFNSLRQAFVHDRHTFNDIVAAFVAEQFDVVADCIRIYRSTPNARSDGDRLFFVWLLLGSPAHVREGFSFPGPGTPERDEVALAQAWNLAYNDECTFTEEVASMFFDMLVVLDVKEVLDAFEARQRLRTLAQGPFTRHAAIESLEASHDVQ